MAAMSIRKRGSVKRAPVMENASEWEQMWRSRHKKEKKKLGQVESILRMNLWNSLRGQGCLREIFSSTYITNKLASSFKVLEKSWMSISLPKEVLDVNIITDIETGNSRGFGFVTMATVEEAKKGVELFNRYSLEGRLLTVNKAAPRGTKFERPAQPASANKIYVGNLPWQADDNSLLQLFSEHGKVLEARVVYDRETGRSRGFGFVTYSSESEVNDAIAALDGNDMDGRPLRVNIAEDRSRRGF